MAKSRHIETDAKGRRTFGLWVPERDETQVVLQRLMQMRSVVICRELVSQSWRTGLALDLIHTDLFSTEQEQTLFVSGLVMRQMLDGRETTTRPKQNSE